MKTTKKSRETVRPVSRKPLLKRLLGSVLGIFTEDLPVSKYAGTGRFSFEVAKTRERQIELEAITQGGRPAKYYTEAVLIPTAGLTMPVSIDDRRIGELKPADAKALRAQQAAVHHEPFALHVPAVIQAGKRKKNGSAEFAVFLDLPIKARSGGKAKAGDAGRGKTAK